MTDIELEQLAKNSMKEEQVQVNGTPPPQLASTEPDMEAFAMLGGMVNANSKNINDQMAQVGTQQDEYGGRLSSNIKPITKEAVSKPVLPPDMGNASNAPRQFAQPVQSLVTPQPQIQPPVYNTPQNIVQQPVYQQPTQQVAQPYNAGVVFPPNLQSIILGKMLAIEKTHVKIIETQKEILDLLKKDKKITCQTKKHS